MLGWSTPGRNCSGIYLSGKDSDFALRVWILSIVAVASVGHMVQKVEFKIGPAVYFVHLPIS